MQLGGGTDRINALVGHAPLWRQQVPALADSAAYHTGTINLSLDAAGAAPPEQVVAAAVSCNFFPLLGVPLAGPGWRAGCDHAVVLSRQLALRFGLRPGGAVRVNGAPWLVAGIAPAGFALPRGVAAWLPLPDPWTYASDPLQSRVLFFPVIGRLRPGATAAAATRQLAAALALPQSARSRVAVTSLRQHQMGDSAGALWLLQAAVGLVLLIACANVANLQLTRALRRRDELRVRAALGASRSRLARQQCAEALALAMAGGTAGIALAAFCLPLLRRMLPVGLPLTGPLTLDVRVLGFALAAVMITALTIGLFSLRAGSRAAPRFGRERHNQGLRNALSVGEISLALVLLAGAGLLLSSLARLAAVNPGFRPDGVLTAKLTLSGARYQTPAARALFYQRLLERLQALPGVTAAALGNNLPLNPGPTFAGQLASGDNADAYFTEVSPGYFATLGVPLLAGRDFSALDREGSPQVVMVSRSLAQTLWPHKVAAGQALTMPAGGGKTITYHVVGVVGDLRLQLAGDPAQAIYFPLAQAPTNALALVLRTAGDPAALAGPLRRAVAALDRDLPIAEVATLPALTRQALAQPAFRSLLLGLFALLALGLSVAGVAAVMAFNAAARTHEIGVRIALGAHPRRIAAMMFRHTLALTLTGLALGVAGALATARLLGHYLYATNPYDWRTLTAAATLLTAGCLAAGWWPASRTAHLDPCRALRRE
jgi:predicted permease